MSMQLVLQQIIVIFCYVAVGVGAGKLNIINPDQRKYLTQLCSGLILPFTILSAASMEIGGEGFRNLGIDITYHDMSMIGSMAGVLNAAGYEEGEKILAGQLREIGRRVNEAGGIIGHIKFVLTAQGQSCQISVTDEEESIRRFTSNSCHVEGVAIVFNLEEDTLRAILRETLGSVLTVSGS